MKYLLTVLVFLSMLVVVSCSNQPEPDIQATIAAGIAATQTAAPTNTVPPPTDTPTRVPTHTPTPEPTASPTPEPTNTPVPTPASPLLSSTITASQLKTGHTLYQLPQEGFAIALPQDWQVVDLEKMKLPEVLETMAEQNENLEGLLSTRLFKNLVATGIKFYAINLNQASLQATLPATINVLKQDLPFEPTTQMYTTLSVSQLEQLFDLTSEIEQDQITLGDVEAGKISYTVEMVDPLGRTVEVMNSQYLVLDGPLAYIVTLSIPVELADDHLSTFAEAVETFRLLD